MSLLQIWHGQPPAARKAPGQGSSACAQAAHSRRSTHLGNVRLPLLQPALVGTAALQLLLHLCQLVIKRLDKAEDGELGRFCAGRCCARAGNPRC